MNLSRFGQKWYEVEISTVPQVSTGWEATFDGGTTWVAGEVVTEPDPAPVVTGAVVVRWLLAGSQAPAVDTAPDVVLTDGVQPILRAAANPEVEAFAGPLIILE